MRAQLDERQVSEQAWQASAKVRRVGDRYRLELSLEVQGSVAQRVVEAASCATLADTASVLIALAVLDAREPASTPSQAETAPESQQPAAAGTEPAAGPVAGSVPNAAASASAAPEPADEEAQAEPTSNVPDTGGGRALAFSFGLGATLRLDVGMLPAEPAFGLAPRVLAKLGPLTATVGLTFWLAAADTPERYPSARIEGRGILGDVVLGFELTREPLSFAPCLALEHGRLQVRSLDIQTPDSAGYSWTAAGGGMRAGVDLGPGLFATLELLGLVPWSPQGFLLRTPEGDLPVFRAAPLVLRISAELAYVFE